MCRTMFDIVFQLLSTLFKELFKSTTDFTLVNRSLFDISDPTKDFDAFLLSGKLKFNSIFTGVILFVYESLGIM